MGNLIMPKQTAEVAKLIATLEILHKAKINGKNYISNHEYKVKIINKVDSFSNNSDGAMLIKQSEIARYFGYALGNFEQRKIGITDDGLKFYEAYTSNDQPSIIQLLANSIEKLSFGRNNTAIKSSDSDIDPPKLFIKSIFDLKGISSIEFAALIYLTNDICLTYDSAIDQIMNQRKHYVDITIPPEKTNKYKDCKFPAFLEEIGFCEKDAEKKFHLSSKVSSTIIAQLHNINIYNTHPSMLKDLKNSTFDDEGTSSSSYSTKVNSTLGYDLGSDAFKFQNTRPPSMSIKNVNSEKYTTNPRIGKTALELANHCCENDITHSTFLNKALVPFMEPHHLIPMSAQKDFEQNLDCVENIVSLCPNCHSAVHYGHIDVRKKYLFHIYENRIGKLNGQGIYISFEDLLNKYYK